MTLELRSPQRLAQLAIQNAIARREIPRARTLNCAFDPDCGPAIDYHHHAGYDEPNRLLVTPLCRQHHQYAHGYKKQP